MGWFALSLWDVNKDEYIESDLVCGDSVADIMGVAVDKIIEIYKDEVGRMPCKQEMHYLLDFCTGPFKLQDIFYGDAEIEKDEYAEPKLE